MKTLQALELVGIASRATGTLFLEECTVEKMSGFFVTDLFVTCAHFLQFDGIEDKMRKLDSRLAHVSTSREPFSMHDKAVDL